MGYINRDGDVVDAVSDENPLNELASLIHVM